MTSSLLSLLEVRDSTYEYGHPWFSWVVIDAETNQIVGCWKQRHDAEIEMHRLAEAAELSCLSSTVPLVDQGAASAKQTGGLLSSASSFVQPFACWSSPHPHRPHQ